MNTRIKHLCVKNLFAGYEGKSDWTSKHINFEVSAGEILAIMGPSGSGKSTLLKGVLGAISRRKGQVFVNGEDVSASGLRCMRDRVGWVPQDDILIDELTVKENITYFHKIAIDSGLADSKISTHIDESLQKLNISAQAHSRVGKPGGGAGISGGQKKRANIAMELVNDPDVLIIDEPTSGLSSKDSLDLITNLSDIANGGGLPEKKRIVIIIIHQPSSEIFKLFDRLLLLDGKGNCITSGKAMDVLNAFVPNGECGRCGNVQPDRLLELVEARGDWTNVAQQFGETFSTIQPAALDKVPKAKLIRSPIESISDLWTLIKRQLLIRRRDPMSVAITLAAPPLLGFLLAGVFKATTDNLDYSFVNNVLFPQALFMLIIGSMFLGLLTSVIEIIKDRRMLSREEPRGLSLSAYYFSELISSLMVGAVQATLLVYVALHSLEANELFWQILLVVALAQAVSIAMGLLLSMLFRSETGAYVLVALVIIPQIILGGALLSYKDMGKEMYLWEKRDVAKRPLLASLMPSSWAYQMVMRSTFDQMQKDKISQNVAINSIADIRPGRFLSPHADRVPSADLTKHLSNNVDWSAAYVNDGIVLLFIFIGLAGTGLVWIGKDYQDGTVKRFFWQGVIIVGLPFAYFGATTLPNEEIRTSIVASQPTEQFERIPGTLTQKQAQEACTARGGYLPKAQQIIATFIDHPRMISGYYWASGTASNGKTGTFVNLTKRPEQLGLSPAAFTIAATKTTKLLDQRLQVICHRTQ